METERKICWGSVKKKIQRWMWLSRLTRTMIELMTMMTAKKRTRKKKRKKKKKKKKRKLSMMK
jgi:hypothetical protein